MDLVKYGKASRKQIVKEGFLAILDQQDPLSSESDYVLLHPRETIPKNSNVAFLRTGTLAEIQLEKRLYNTTDDNLVEVGAKVHVELDPTHTYEFMIELINKQDLSQTRLEEKLNIETIVHRQVSEGLQELIEICPNNNGIFSEYMESEINNALTAYGLKLNTTVTIDRPDLETQNLVRKNKLEVEQIDSRRGVLEALVKVYEDKARMIEAQIRAIPEYIQAELESERDIKEADAFFNNTLANKFIEKKGKDSKIIQVGRGGTANINIGSKKKNNNS
jgi:hypothetical protein|tara:strand:- start:394 stop:1224 length:831 start_codon:yes stop_codon:yes gene_type:complete